MKRRASRPALFVNAASGTLQATATITRGGTIRVNAASALAVLLVMLLFFKAYPAAAGATGTVTLIGPAEVSAPVQEPVVESLKVSLSNSTQAINVTLPQGWSSAEAVIVKVDTNVSGATISALNASGAVLATADIVPLASGFAITFPGDTAIVEVSYPNADVWEGVITIIVQDTVRFKFQFPQEIVVSDGAGQGRVYIEQLSGPPGSIYISEQDPIFDVYFVDPSPEALDDKIIETTGAGWRTTTTVAVKADAKPGEYRVKLSVYFTTTPIPGGDPRRPGILVASIDAIFKIAEVDGGGSGGDGSGGVPWAWVGLGAVAALVLFFLARGK